ncbi:MAG: hypothetical protein RLZZ569_880 [Bacteroidota bacterium]
MITNKQLLGAILSLTIGTLSAQDKAADKRDQLVFGIKAGMNVSNVWDEQGADFVADPKLGAAGGVFLAVPIGKYFGVQPEVLFSQKGFKGGGSLLGFPYSFTRTTSYIDVPILVQFKPIEYFTLLAGPQFSYLLKEKNVYTFGSNSSEQEQAFSNEDVRNNILGFVVGADVTVKAFVVSARAGWDFQNNNKNGVSTTPRYKNQFLQLTIGFRI